MKTEEIIETRYSTKKFDINKKINEEDMEIVKKLLQLAPSSINLQPWHFVIATTKEGKALMAKSTEQNFSFNTEKILDASAVVLFTTKTDVTEEYLKHIVDKENIDGRYKSEDVKINTTKGRTMFLNKHKNILKDSFIWSEKQTYLNVGNFLLGLASLGIDSVPMEGFDNRLMDDLLDLKDKGFTSSVLVPIGYRDESDFNANLPKSRLDSKELIDLI